MGVDGFLHNTSGFPLTSVSVDLDGSAWIGADFGRFGWFGRICVDLGGVFGRFGWIWMHLGKFWWGWIDLYVF